jgi:transcriptional regulator with XRE-family HTH domain
MLGKNLRYYRLLSNMSQQELADKVGLSKMAISHYENSKRVPKMNTLKELAHALGISVLSFISCSDESLTFEHGTFAGENRLNATEQELIQTQIERYFCRFFTLLSILGESVLPEAPHIEPFPIADSEQGAQTIRKKIGLARSGPIGNLVDILENKGFLIYKGAFKQGFSSLNGTVCGRPYIAINKDMLPEKQRLTIAGELTKIFSQKVGPSCEREIKAIANAFLLPREDLIRELGPKRTEIRGELFFLQKEYGLPMAAVAGRAYQVKIINKGLYRKLASWLSQDPPWDEQTELKSEEPHLFEQLACRAVMEDKVGPERALELLKLPYDKLDSVLGICGE